MSYLETLRSMTGRMIKESGREINRADHIDRIDRAMTAFGEQRVQEKTPIFSLGSTSPISQFRDVIAGSVTQNADRYEIGPMSRLESAEIGRYVPGFSAEVGIGVRMQSASVSSRWGFYDSQDGFYFDCSPVNGLRAGIRRDGVDTLEPLNLDPLDGTGDSGVEYSPEEGYIFQINFTWYGFGIIVFDLISKEYPSKTIPVHVFIPGGDTTIKNPNLCVTVENTGGTGIVECTGRQFSIIGKFAPQERVTGAWSPVKTIGTSFEPIISWRRRAGDQYRFFSLTTSAIDIINGQRDVEYALLLNPVLTGASPFLPPLRSTTETAIEFDISASAYSGGESFFYGLIQGSGTGSRSAAQHNEPRIRIPRDYWVTLVARAIDATSEIHAMISAIEEW